MNSVINKSFKDMVQNKIKPRIDSGVLKEDPLILLSHVISQLFSSSILPGQFNPPFIGAGLSHCRIRICFPIVWGQFALQFDHGDQIPQFPSATKVHI